MCPVRPAQRHPRLRAPASDTGRLPRLAKAHSAIHQALVRSSPTGCAAPHRRSGGDRAAHHGISAASRDIEPSAFARGSPLDECRGIDVMWLQERMSSAVAATWPSSRRATITCSCAAARRTRMSVLRRPGRPAGGAGTGESEPGRGVRARCSTSAPTIGWPTSSSCTTTRRATRPRRVRSTPCGPTGSPLRRSEKGDWQRLARAIARRAIGLVLSAAWRGLCPSRRHARPRGSRRPDRLPRRAEHGRIVAAGIAMDWPIGDRSSASAAPSSTAIHCPTIRCLCSAGQGQEGRAPVEGERRHDDLRSWRPFFCISSNLTTARSRCIPAATWPKRGASISLPAYCRRSPPQGASWSTAG